MKKVFYLSTCSTCKRILSEVSLPHDIEKRDIKNHPITQEEWTELKTKARSYLALFSKKARNYQSYKHLELTESLMETLLRSDYTFLKRPVVVYEDFLSIGNEANSIDLLKKKFS